MIILRIHVLIWDSLALLHGTECGASSLFSMACLGGTRLFYHVAGWHVCHVRIYLDPYLDNLLSLKYVHLAGYQWAIMSAGPPTTPSNGACRTGTHHS